MLSSSRYKTTSTLTSLLSSPTKTPSPLRLRLQQPSLSLSLTTKPHHRTMSTTTPSSTKPPLPPFTHATALLKVKAAQDLWNTRDPSLVKNGYTADSIWRNRDTFLQGTEEIVKFLTEKWSVENGYRLRKELFAFTDDKIAVQFWYEWHDASSQWWRTYGLEDWTFAPDGRMRKRQMSANDVKISDGERWFKEGVDVNAVDIEEKHW